MVSKERFAAAQKQLKENIRSYTDNELLDSLTALWCREKYLTKDIIEASPNTPSSNTIKARFGGLMDAYSLIGFNSKTIALRQTNLELRKSAFENICEGIIEEGGCARKLSRGFQVRVNEELTVAVVLACTCPSNQQRRQNQWQFGYRTQRKPDILVVVRADTGRTSIRDYFILPFAFLPHGAWLTISGRNYRRLEHFRSETLPPLYKLCGRHTVSL